MGLGVPEGVRLVSGSTIFLVFDSVIFYGRWTGLGHEDWSGRLDSVCK